MKEGTEKGVLSEADFRWKHVETIRTIARASIAATRTLEKKLRRCLGNCEVTSAAAAELAGIGRVPVHGARVAVEAARNLKPDTCERCSFYRAKLAGVETFLYGKVEHGLVADASCCVGAVVVAGEGQETRGDCCGSRLGPMQPSGGAGSSTRPAVFKSSCVAGEVECDYTGSAGDAGYRPDARAVAAGEVLKEGPVLCEGAVCTGSAGEAGYRPEARANAAREVLSEGLLLCEVVVQVGAPTASKEQHESVVGNPVSDEVGWAGRRAPQAGPVPQEPFPTT